MLFANAPKTWIRDIAEMLGGLDCSKSYFLALCHMLLSEKSPKSLKLSGFYKLSSGLQLIWAFYSQVQERTLKVFRSFKTLPFIDNVYGENLRLQKETFWLRPRLLPLSSPEETLWFSALRREEKR